MAVWCQSEGIAELSEKAEPGGKSGIRWEVGHLGGWWVSDHE